jgi:hypothetical protein
MSLFKKIKQNKQFNYESLTDHYNEVIMQIDKVYNKANEDYIRTLRILDDANDPSMIAQMETSRANSLKTMENCLVRKIDLLKLQEIATKNINVGSKHKEEESTTSLSIDAKKELMELAKKMKK